MAEIELIMPKMGESVAEATIIKWLKEEGDTIEAEESVLEIATDKVDSEVPAPEDGVLIKKLFNEDDVVQVGQVIAIIQTEGGAAAAPSAPASEAPAQETSSAPAAAQEAEKMVANGVATAAIEIPRSANGKFFSPLVRSIAKEENVSLGELENLNGSGSEGRVTKADILAYVENRGSAPAAAPSAPAPAAKSAPAAAPAAKSAPAPKPAAPVSIGANDEIIEMDRMRKMIADHMVMSKHTSPHVTSFVEADVTNLVNWRNKVKGEFLKREGEKITFTPLIIEALVKAIKDFPMINVSVDGTNIIKRGNINIGMAAALPSGNLIVPVIKNADNYNLVGLTKQVNDLARRARENKLSPDEISGGTYTLTNVGTFGNVLGTPIINQPQVAIMAAGAIIKKPAVVETPEGDMIAIRHKMFLSHSYDHRVVDGALGGMFVRRVADYLEQFDPNREF
ncbi:dihydrolipoamide acetyltransferase family protein [Croceimicrobium hydrocarbonivorans]|uniref:Dihydrolipoamide acetyltransferase component of pyruvate dehydrogenase complex n=1 Tax=Croceimicrobium hydrocarbonivorans TaxID=2761580 RepID=A0A7H0VD95_9FLAO|nr:dihydrolipoamide acetyltransferase family protein [Croceimicrobium hydrocarbonivorans]QNR23693.1 2-oxo acid dehydrogenase subunit E2 [Croceimicrobium hydrocarbonivorans]